MQTDRAATLAERNRANLIRWRVRYEAATGKTPDIHRHQRALRRGLKFPVEHHPNQGFTLRPCGQARTPFTETTA